MGFGGGWEGCVGDREGVVLSWVLILVWFGVVGSDVGVELMEGEHVMWGLWFAYWRQTCFDSRVVVVQVIPGICNRRGFGSQ